MCCKTPTEGSTVIGAARGEIRRSASLMVIMRISSVAVSSERDLPSVDLDVPALVLRAIAKPRTTRRVPGAVGPSSGKSNLDGRLKSLHEASPGCVRQRGISLHLHPRVERVF